jgi:hypothetical protein
MVELLDHYPVEIQNALTAENARLPLERRMEFRIGVDSGDAIGEGQQIYVDGVNVAARLESPASCMIRSMVSCGSTIGISSESSGPCVSSVRSPNSMALKRTLDAMKPNATCSICLRLVVESFAFLRLS